VAKVDVEEIAVALDHDVGRVAVAYAEHVLHHAVACV
jgi:hypothetical protein